MSGGSGRMVAIALVAACLTTMSACVPGDDGPAPSPGSTTTSTPVECLGYEEYGDLTGKAVTVYTPIVAPEDQPHIDSFTTFEKCTGAKINYEGSREFETQLPVKIEAGSPPDIAYLPQPGLLNTLVRRFPGKVMEVTGPALVNVEQNYTATWLEHGSVDGRLYAVPVGASAKSLVWYSPRQFTANGYEVPATWDELVSLTERIAAEHPEAKPWCVGLESGGSTGWPATDWLEDMMLRTVTPAEYDSWVAHEMPFDDPRVVAALDRVATILKNPAHVNGGHGNVKSAADVPFVDAGLPVLEGTCFMHRQASFYQANWPNGTRIAEDGDVFAFRLPGQDVEPGPVLSGGEFAAAFSDREEVRAFQTYLTSPEWSNEKAKVTPAGWVSTNRHLDPENLSSPIDRLAFELLTDENTVIRFDGSDLMPSTVGAGTFPKGMSNWIALDRSSVEVLAEIEASWPRTG
ncbi:MAG: ABC transporter substrate-binding protein [Arachnia propionica]|uniref:ABC transporter substrate-binding protein n=1 Tax=Arachnia propionica TaxID=1750 RepID=UPI0027001D27|nr:ABC transporter substrate-binding protein [Arachnia propionica]